MRTINLYNEFHFGDSIFTTHYLNKYINEDLMFNYYIKDEYIEQLSLHIKNKNINLLSINNGVPINSFNMWIGHNRYYWDNLGKYNNMFDLFYVDFFKMVSNKLEIPSKINNRNDLLFDNDNYKTNLNRKFDFLIINSVPHSGQFNYNEIEFINLCDFFNEKKINFITTKKIKDFECTLDYNMSTVDIGNLSNFCENIIAINTAPIISTFTIQNIDYVKKRFILDRYLSYSFNEGIFRLDNLNSIYKML